MKKITSLVLVIVMLASLALFTACNKPEEPVTPEYARMTIDINPSVEFMLDEEGKVASVTALNDDGSILIAGEVFVGKTAEEATELMLTVAGETGYLVKGNVTADENNVKISVSGDGKYAEELYKKVEAEAKSTLEAIDVEAIVTEVDAMGVEALRELAVATAGITEEEAEAMTEAELCEAISAARIETALLLTEELRELYYEAKDYEIEFAKSRYTAELIEGLGGLYTLLLNQYNKALETCEKAVDTLEKLRYETLIDPDSQYQKALVALRESKTELLKQRTYTASLDVNGEEFASAEVKLGLDEERYEQALAAFERIGEAANLGFDSAIAGIEAARLAMKSIEETLPDSIEEQLTADAEALETYLNDAKDGFFTEFETLYGEDIAKIEEQLLAEKAKLKGEAA
ncbi:MAG: hypothetical protein IKC32_02805 [Clostridia bacterium]|nr:hypothetical protein [Clostridia bacterium]